MGAFPLVDRCIGLRMEVDLGALRPGAIAVVESPRCMQREQGHGFIRALWWLRLAGGRSAASVPPGAGHAVSRILEKANSDERLLAAGTAEELRPPVNDSLRQAGLKNVDRVWADLCFACNASLLRSHVFGDCRRLVDASIPPAEGLKLPTHCFPDGIAYGVVADGRIVSAAFAHREGIMEDQVAHLGVETAATYRRRGYAKTAVSAVVEHVTRSRGEAYYACRPDNLASITTARGVGFVPYGTSLVLAAPTAE